MASESITEEIYDLLTDDEDEDFNQAIGETAVQNVPRNFVTPYLILVANAGGLWALAGFALYGVLVSWWMPEAENMVQRSA
jgi:hypothetical protein